MWSMSQDVLHWHQIGKTQHGADCGDQKVKPGKTLGAGKV